MRHPRPSGSLLAVVASSVALLAGATLVPAQAAAPAVDLQPQKLARGADIAVPHIEDGDFVDGARRVELPGTVARVIGASGDTWLVGTSNVDRNRNRRVVRVETDGTVTDVLTNIDTTSVILSADGSTLAWQRYVSKGRKVITYAASAEDGTLLGSKGPDRYVSLLDVDATRVILGGGTRVLQWKPTTDRTRTITKALSGVASIEHDLLATYTKDPYLGGCTRLVRLSDPSDTLWRSCRERVQEISPDGTRIATVDLLSDGIGPGRVWQRSTSGALLAAYDTSWFGSIGWESPSTMLLEVNGKRKASTVRCELDACENATDPVKVSSP
jgi:hypothetical protein